MADKLILASDLRAELQKYGEGLRGVVSTPVSEDFPGFLSFFDHHDEFYTMTDLATGVVSWTLGIEKWLGYEQPAAGPLPMDLISGYVHPFLRDWYRIVNDAATLVFTRYPTRFLRSRFVLSVPMRKAGGQYVLVKQMSMPFEYDRQGRVARFIHSFTLFGDYREEFMRLTLFRSAKLPYPELYAEIERLLVSCIRLRTGKKSGKMTGRHWDVLTRIRQLRDRGEEVTPRSIADGLTRSNGEKLKTNSVVHYLQTIKDRLLQLLYDPAEGVVAEPFFLEQLQPLEVLFWLEQSDLLSVVETFLDQSFPDRSA